MAWVLLQIEAGKLIRALLDCAIQLILSLFCIDENEEAKQQTMCEMNQCAHCYNPETMEMTATQQQ